MPFCFRLPMVKKIALGGLFLTLGACATTDVAPITANSQPDRSSDEAGIWLQVERGEKQLKASAVVERDPALNEYVRGVVCQIAGDEFCKDIRVYIVKQPYFNASMAPNGVMQVWTGLLLRAENEAQMAFVIGHEFAHYRQRHSLQQWRELKNAANASLLFSLGVAVAGVPEAAVLGDFTLAARLYGYGRNKEREADDLGYGFSAAAGYDGRQAAEIWNYLISEVGSSDSKRKKKNIARASIFSTHPVTSDRVSTLEALAKANPGGNVVNEEKYIAMTAPFLAQWLDADLVRRDFGENLYLINHLLTRGKQQGLLYYRRGEAYRIRRQEGDREKALTDYRMAANFSDAPPEVWRQMGEVLRKSGQQKEAAAAFVTYLKKSPDASDKLFIEAYLARLGA